MQGVGVATTINKSVIFVILNYLSQESYSRRCWWSLSLLNRLLLHIFLFPPIIIQDFILYHLYFLPVIGIFKLPLCFSQVPHSLFPFLQADIFQVQDLPDTVNLFLTPLKSFLLLFLLNNQSWDVHPLNSALEFSILAAPPLLIILTASLICLEIAVP